MRAATCFSGIGAPECAAPWLDWRWCAEIEPFPAAVHAHRFPGVVNLGDVLAPDFLDRAEQVDVLVGGPPCQSFSIAGLRGGLADPRGNLTLRWVQVIHAVRPRYAVTENVPGWLSSRDNAFGCFLAGIVGADDPLRTPDGGSWPRAGMAAGPLGRAAWRVLDAQHFGVPQRRERVFVVFCPVGGGDPAAVLFEPQGVPGHPAARGKAREDVARPLAAGSPSSGGYRNDADTADNLIAHSLRGEGFDASEDGTGRGTPLVIATTLRARDAAKGVDSDCTDTLIPVAFGGNNQAGPIDVATARNAHAGPHGRLDFESETFVVQPTAYRVTGNDGAYSTGDAVGALGTMTDPSAQVIAFEAKRAGQSSDLAPTLRAMGHAESHPNAGGQVAVQYASGVRRLLPVECERLQGFPDGWTDIVHRGKPAADGNRYKAIGNSMAVPVLGWLLDRVRADALRPRTAA
jgi:DNA (cytosine-5)-methyltransferase 1